MGSPKYVTVVPIKVNEMERDRPYSKKAYVQCILIANYRQRQQQCKVTYSLVREGFLSLGLLTHSKGRAGHSWYRQGEVNPGPNLNLRARTHVKELDTYGTGRKMAERTV